MLRRSAWIAVVGSCFLFVGSLTAYERNYYHSDGSKSLYRGDEYGGTMYYGDGSKSLYYGNGGHGTVYHSDGSKTIW